MEGVSSPVHTPSVVSGGGLALALARFGSPEPGHPAAALYQLARALGALRVEWITDGAPSVGSEGGIRSRESDPEWLESILPGAVRTRGGRGSIEESRARRGLVAPGTREVWARSRGQVGRSGWLRVVCREERSLAPEEAGAIAEILEASLTPKLPAVKQPGGQDPVHWRAVIHDVCNEITHARLALQVSAMRGEAPEADVSETLYRAGQLCASALGGEKPPSAGRFDLGRVLRNEVAAAAHSSRARSDAEAELDCTEDIWVSGDGARLARVVRNAVLNALEASPRGGMVQVRARADESRVTITVEDHGRGMSRNEVDSLFQPGVTGGQGTGWGTTSILEGVKSLNGTLAIETGPDAGTLVELTLHRAPAPGTAATMRIVAEGATPQEIPSIPGDADMWTVHSLEVAVQQIRYEAEVVGAEVTAGVHPDGWRQIRDACEQRRIPFSVRSVSVGVGRRLPSRGRPLLIDS